MYFCGRQTDMSKGLRAGAILAAAFFTLASGGWAVEPDGKMDEAFLLLMAARNAAKANQVEQAVSRYQQLLEKHPQLTEARTELGWVFVRVGKLDQAKRQFETVLEAKPRDADALKGLLEVLKKSGEKEQAFKVTEQLVAILPEDRDLRMQLAVELHNRGKYAEAEKHLNMLLQTGERK